MLRYALFCGSLILAMGRVVCAAEVNELVIRAAPEKVAVRFGQPLQIRVTVENASAAAISISPGDLYLTAGGWRSEGGGGTGLGANVRLKAADTDSRRQQAEIEIAPKNRVILTGSHHDWTVLALGRMEAELRVGTENPRLERLLPSKPLTIAFEVTPSQLMLDAFASKTEADRARLREAMRDFLRQRAAARTSRDRHYVEHTLEYMAGYALPLLEDALGDEDPVVRAQAMSAFRYGVWAVGNMNTKLSGEKRPPWARNLVLGDKQAAQATLERLATRALQDNDAQVRVAAVNVLNWSDVESALPDVRDLANDGDPKVRSAVQDYLGKYASKPGVADEILASLNDPSQEVRDKALAALENGPPPPLASLQRAFQRAKGETALRLLALLFEQEDAALGGTLLPGFSKRCGQVRLACVTAMAGHADEASVDLIRLALRDNDVAVQRAALLRTLALRKDDALPWLDQYIARRAAPELEPVAQAVRNEITDRRLFPFLDRSTAASESEFPSQKGTVPMVSPDGQWVAYVETGWSRPGGSGGTGRSNLTSLVHAVKIDGTDDRVVSDMFLACWLADSRHVGSLRDGFAAVCDLYGNPVIEFGEPYEFGLGGSTASDSKEAAEGPAEWVSAGDLRTQFGVRMPHRRRLPRASENATISPDGQWFGPMQDRANVFLLGSDGQRKAIQVPERAGMQQAAWSPDGRYIFVHGSRSMWQTGLVIDTQSKTTEVIKSVDPTARFGSWEYRKCRWNPWAKDGSKLALVRNGQVWICSPNGSDARQLTFDSARKAFPTFSRDGTRVAYVTWQPDNRRHYTRLGPTDLWVVDVTTTLAARVTAKSTGRIHCLDWIDDDTLIFDRLARPATVLGYDSTLRRLDLTASQ
jgi:HEAT repeat protein